MPGEIEPTKLTKIRPVVPCLRTPSRADGSRIWELVRECAPLDENSMYCNLIQADHFGETCVVAEMKGEIVGWISGYIIPESTTLFVWQVAVGKKARGNGLGKTMLKHLLGRDACAEVNQLQTTITKDNGPSWALFRSFASAIGGELSDAPHYKSEAHFAGHHKTEHMVTIALDDASGLDALKSAA